MKKMFAVAAMVVAGLAAPALPVHAAEAMPKDGCLVAPLLRAECRDIIREKAQEAKLPLLWWACTPAPAGSKYMLSCD